MPRFEAACPGGAVGTAEIGDLKREIVHSGHTLNTVARMEAPCRPLGRLLVSDALLDRCALPPGLQAEEVGTVALRGEEAPVRLFGLERGQIPS